ncbi:hypothetical protein ACHAXR_007186 [Thalassiosira sp. AJA248-18]
MDSYHPGTCPPTGRRHRGTASWSCCGRGRSADGCTLLQARRPFYFFGKWGCHTRSTHASQIMPGFSPTPPGREICGAYKIIFVGAIHHKKRSKRQAKVLLGRQPQSGSLVIEESAQTFTIGGNGRQITDQVMFEGQVSLPNGGRGVDICFGPGYKFYGFDANSEATLSYPSMASNASLIVTKMNDNKGRIYKVQSRKALKLVNKTSKRSGEQISFDSQEHEVIKAERICKCRHFSFLCRKLGLPCSASALITAFVAIKHPPYIFAEPGDVWIDIRLSTPVSTYVLARREPAIVFSEEMLMLRAKNMRMKFLQNFSEEELLASMDETLGTPDAGAKIIGSNINYLLCCDNSENVGSVVEMIAVLYRNNKVSKSVLEDEIRHLNESFWSTISWFIASSLRSIIV